MKKNDFLLIFIVLVVALSAYGLQLMKGTDDSASVVVSVDGEQYGTYALNEDQVIEINDTNTLTISGGSADMTDADCPDKLCVHQKAISKTGESIICLPNKIIVTIEDGEEAAVDAVTD